MIKTRLIRLISHAKKYIALNILWQWLALLAQIAAIFSIAGLLEKAGNLSGGQCQRLALARALLHDTPVYLFDEATSNIDVESEELIMEVIRELAKSRTVLLISHRLANVVTSDTVFMLENGQIREAGSHEELMRQKGSYYKLYESQRVLEEYASEEKQ